MDGSGTGRADADVHPAGFAAVQTVLREREARDREWWPEVAASWLPDAEVSVSWFQGNGRDFLAASQAMSASGTFVSRHRLGAPTVRTGDGRAVVAVPAIVELLPTVDGVPCVLSAYCRLLFRLRLDGVWLIAGMHAIYERDALDTAVPGQRITVDPAELAGLRESYRLLGWTLARAGYPVNQELYGDDRPEQVAGLYRDAYTWAGLR